MFLWREDIWCIPAKSANSPSGPALLRKGEWSIVETRQRVVQRISAMQEQVGRQRRPIPMRGHQTAPGCHEMRWDLTARTPRSCWTTLLNCAPGSKHQEGDTLHFISIQHFIWNFPWPCMSLTLSVRAKVKVGVMITPSVVVFQINVILPKYK